MKNNVFDHIKDAYQLVQGAKIKGKSADELFELGEYDPNKRGYVIYPFEDGLIYSDFSMIMSEKELMSHYMIEVGKISPFAKAA